MHADTQKYLRISQIGIANFGNDGPQVAINPAFEMVLIECAAHLYAGDPIRAAWVGGQVLGEKTQDYLILLRLLRSQCEHVGLQIILNDTMGMGRNGSFFCKRWLEEFIAHTEHWIKK